MYKKPWSNISLTNAQEKSEMEIQKSNFYHNSNNGISEINIFVVYIQLITSSSMATCLKRRWNFFWRLLLNDLRFFSVEAPSFDLLAIDLTELEFMLEFDDKLTLAGGWRWSCTAGVDEVDAADDEAFAIASDTPLIDDVIFGITFVFDTTGFIDEQSNWFFLLFLVENVTEKERTWKQIFISDLF